MSQLFIEENIQFEKYTGALVQELDKMKKVSNLDELNLFFKKNIEKDINNFLFNKLKNELSIYNFNNLFYFLNSKLHDTNRNESMFIIIKKLLKNDIESLLENINSVELRKKLVIEINELVRLYKIGEKQLLKNNDKENAIKLKTIIFFFDYLNKNDVSTNKFKERKIVKKLLLNNLELINNFFKKIKERIEKGNHNLSILELTKNEIIGINENNKNYWKIYNDRNFIFSILENKYKQNSFNYFLTLFLLDQNSSFEKLTILLNKYKVSNYALGINIENKTHYTEFDFKGFKSDFLDVDASTKIYDIKELNNEKNMLIHYNSIKKLNTLKSTFKWLDNINGYESDFLIFIKKEFSELKSKMFENIINANVSKNSFLYFIEDSNDFSYFELYDKYQKRFNIKKSINKKNIKNIDKDDLKIMYLLKLQKDVHNFLYHKIVEEINFEKFDENNENNFIINDNELSNEKNDVFNVKHSNTKGLNYNDFYKKIIKQIEDENNFNFNDELVFLIKIEKIEDYYNSNIGKLLLKNDLKNKIDFYLKKSFEYKIEYPFINKKKKYDICKNILIEIKSLLKYLSNDENKNIVEKLDKFNEFSFFTNENKFSENIKKINLSIIGKFIEKNFIFKSNDIEEFEEELNNLLHF